MPPAWCGSNTREQPHDTELRADRDDLYAARAASTRPFRPTPSEGDVEAALAAAAVTVDQTYTTPQEHNNPMEPHATVALLGGWRADAL